MKSLICMGLHTKKCSWPSLKPSGYGATVYKFVSTRFLRSSITTTCVGSWIQRAWDPDKPDLRPPAVLVVQSKLVRSGSFKSQSSEGRNVSKAIRPKFFSLQVVRWLQLGPLLLGLSLWGSTPSSGCNLFETNLSPLRQILICGIHVLPQLCRSWVLLQGKLCAAGLYANNIDFVRSKLPELQDGAQMVKIFGSGARRR